MEEAVQLGVVVGVDFASRPFISDIGEPTCQGLEKIHLWGGGSSGVIGVVGFLGTLGSVGNGSQPLANEMSKNCSRLVIEIPDF